jgi:hypothetical protein
VGQAVHMGAYVAIGIMIALMLGIMLWGVFTERRR